MTLNDYVKFFELCDSLPLEMREFHKRLCHFFPQYSELDIDCFVEVLIGNNAPFCRIQEKPQHNQQDSNAQLSLIDITTRSLDFRDCKLCFVDIESTSSSVQNGQIIEIGALIAQNGKILDTFDTLIYSPFVPEEITMLTGINATMLVDAPKVHDVLVDFRAFLSDCIFVAHSVGFDYSFISESMQAYDMPPLLNARLCTLELSRKVILSYKHALPFLNEMLGINTSISHRAFADALTSFELYKICALCLPEKVQSIQDVIDFSRGKMNYPNRSTSKASLTKHSTKYALTHNHIVNLFQNS
ncbi:3'-5' exonuclease [Helicobacter didelphidarum]|uniref:3'-5' exonuclease n=1 Tax=Helicobacter didelphidarum TaxID=2040648 RepID=A0A3D8INE2_9HELI|nr:3'-5' exonuclease [Helicobacter didelphidarum]RDU66732.1 3'-5' exonuclease [Helicobacter didelphidarum]